MPDDASDPSRSELDAVVWRPDAQTIERANITRLMRKLGFEVDSDDPSAAERACRAFVAQTHEDPEWFWENALDDLGFEWFDRYETLLDLAEGPAWANWFVGGTTNIALNTVDRHAGGARGARRALIAETEDGGVREFSFRELADEVNRIGNGLRELGVEKGDRVACYMPMVAEVVFAMLAVQKVGAVFVPIFSGYAPPAVKERLEGCGVKVLLTADGSYRRGKPFLLKENADAAVDGVASVERVVVYPRLAGELETPMHPDRDIDWNQLFAKQPAECETARMAAMDPALLIYTSGTTGKPKGTVHSHAGCLAQMAKELGYHFDLKPDDLFWWFSDIGWMMGPWEIIGCLFHGVPFVVFEGAPDHPEPDRVWSMVEKHGVTQLGISPTAIRLLMRSGDEWVDRHSMSTLRALGSTGEPWDPESYDWFFEKAGRGECPIINISGGTDIVGCFLAPLPLCPLKRCSLGSPGLGMAVDVFDEQGSSIVDEVGYLVCKKAAPSMTRGLWNANDKYLETYWSKFPGVWNHGDWAKVDADGQWFLFGRADDTLKIAGRRVGPGEIESALIEHDAVSEAATIGVPCDLKGTDIVCFVVLQPGNDESESLRHELVGQVVGALGKVDKPKDVRFVDDLPKTRSAKILRRLIRAKYLGEELGDLSSVANPEALDAVTASR